MVMLALVAHLHELDQEFLRFISHTIDRSRKIIEGKVGQIRRCNLQADDVGRKADFLLVLVSALDGSCPKGLRVLMRIEDRELSAAESHFQILLVLQGHELENLRILLVQPAVEGGSVLSSK